MAPPLRRPTVRLDDLAGLSLDDLRDGTSAPPPLGDEAKAPGDDDAPAARPVIAKVEPVYAFDVDDPHVSGLTGHFVSRVPTIADRITMARTRARLTGGMSFEALAPDERTILNCIVLSTHCLIEKPDWFSDVLGSMTTHLLVAVGEEVLGHHERWFRSLDKLGTGAPLRSLVAVTPSVGRPV